MNCPNCKKQIPIDQINKFIASRAGSATSKKKYEQSRLNGAKGGRPKKKVMGEKDV